jgi:hypothetical protein
MALIHLIDPQTDRIIEDFDSEKEEFFSAVRTHNLDGLDQLEVVFNSKLEKASKLTDKRKLVVRVEDGRIMEYTILQSMQFTEGKKEVKCLASYQDLIKAKIIRPTTGEVNE